MTIRMLMMAMAGLWFTVPAHAALGLDVNSVRTDGQALHGVVHATSEAGFSVHEITLNDGTRVREYLSKQGQVFGVAWNGPSRPDLQQLLGPHFVDFQQVAANHNGGHAHLEGQNNGFVIHSAGRVGLGFAGSAYLVDQMPAGVSPADIR